MVLRQYDHNFQYKFYTPPPPGLKKKKKNKNKKTNLQVLKHQANYPRKLAPLSQSDVNWFRRSERSRQFSKRKSINNGSLENNKSNGYGIHYMNTNSLQYNPFGYMTDNEIKRNRRLSVHSVHSEDFHSDIVVDCIEVEGSQYGQSTTTSIFDDYSIDDYYWDEEEKTECFQIFPLLQRRNRKEKITNTTSQSLNSAKRWLDRHVDILEDIYLKTTAKGRISQALLVLRAESERKYLAGEHQEKNLEQSRIHQINEDEVASFNDEKEEYDFLREATSENSLKDITGPLGLALFAPLHPDAFEDPSEETDRKMHSSSNDQEINDEEKSVDSASSDSSTYSLPHVKVTIDEEPDSTLASSPRILSLTQMQEINNHLPHSVQLMTWERAYSVSRDGDLFITMLRKIECFRYTLLVIKTDRGEILGGFADAIWRDDARNSSAKYFGSGQSFLFHFTERKNEISSNEEINKIMTIIEEKEQDVEVFTEKNSLSEEELTNQEVEENEAETNALENNVSNEKESSLELKVYNWTGSNVYSQLCDVSKGKLAMGGGGSFGFTVGEWFTKGTTGPCATYGNPSLANDDTFDVWEFEIFGLTPSGF